MGTRSALFKYYVHMWKLQSLGETNIEGIDVQMKFRTWLQHCFDSTTRSNLQRVSCNWTTSGIRTSYLKCSLIKWTPKINVEWSMSNSRVLGEPSREEWNDLWMRSASTWRLLDDLENTNCLFNCLLFSDNDVIFLLYSFFSEKLSNLVIPLFLNDGETPSTLANCDVERTLNRHSFSQTFSLTNFPFFVLLLQVNCVSEWN